MSDLIDKRPLLMWLRDYQFENYAGVGHEKEYNFIENLIKGIENEPTVEAIPKEKLDEIVERLEKHIRYCELCHEEFKNESMSLIYEVQINSYKNAIEIVKEVGGMNE